MLRDLISSSPVPISASMRWSPIALVVALALGACSASEAAEPAAASTQPAATVPTTIAIGTIDDLPPDAITVDEETGDVVIAVGQVADLGGHAEAIPADALSTNDISVDGAWQELGASDAQAACYADLFDRNGWSDDTAAEIAEHQAAFSAAQAEEFESC